MSHPAQGGAQKLEGNAMQQIAGGMSAAGQGAMNAMTYQPQQIKPSAVGAPPTITPQNVAGQGYTAANLAGPQNVQAGTVGWRNLDGYMNPYTDQVVNTALSDMDRMRQMQMNDVGAQATGAGAFGGSRHGLVEAETNRAYLDSAGALGANLRSAGFNTALNSAAQDADRTMSADLANQGANLQTGLANQASQNAARGFSAGAANTANLSNQQAGLNAQTQNSSNRLAAQFANQNTGLQSQMANQQAGLQGASQSLGAANQLANIANLGFGMGQTINSNLAQDGALQQGLQQMLIDAAKGQVGGFTGAPERSLGLPLAALGSAPNQSSQTTSQSPGLFNYLSLGLNALPGLKEAGFFS